MMSKMLTTRLLALALVLGSPSLAHAAAEAEYYLSRGLTPGTLLTNQLDSVSSDPAENDPFPADGLKADKSLNGVGFFAFANETGRVRARVAAAAGAPLAVAGSTEVTWEREFTKDSAATTASFTVNASLLRMFLDRTVTSPDQPSAYLHMKVTLLNKSAIFVQTGTNDDGTPIFALDAPLESVQFKHEARLVGFSGSRSAGLAQEQTTLFDALVYDPVNRDDIAELDFADEVVPSKLSTGEGLSTYETRPYRGRIDLSRIPDKGIFVVRYELIVTASKQDGGENESQAFLGDPLDVDSGFVFETNAEPADDASADNCRARSDPNRYRYDNAGAIVTDTYSGLVWQRCPVGFTFNGNSTAENAGDDRCEAPGTTSVTWQAALQRSVLDNTAAREWRVPNLKELESIIEPTCSRPALDTALFPPSVASFLWSSTPQPLNGAAVLSIDVNAGESASTLKTSNADVLLVSTGDDPPVQPLPLVTVERPLAVLEGDAGTTNLSFPIRLDAPVSTDVSVSFETRDSTALAGQDYTAASGTIVIPAGAQAAEIQVAVLGDTVGEFDEVLELALTGVSDGARVVANSAIGEIDDDEPLISIEPGSAGEGDAGTTLLAFTVSLSAAAEADVSVDFATSDGTATAGADYTSKTGTLVLPAGSTTGTVVVDVLGDQATEGDESFTVTLSDASANATLTLSAALAQGSIVDDDVATLRALNDTGLTVCADATSSGKSCAQTATFPGQDAQFGRDATNNDNADGDAGFSFTKLDAGGVPLANQSAPFGTTPWDCVRDEITGLDWEVKTDNGGLRDKDWTYTWFNSTGGNDGGSAGSANGGVCFDTSNCDTEKYVSAVNAAGLCGRNDWRLPTREELQSIVNISQFNTAPRYDIDFFANPPPSLSQAHWTSTPDASSSAIAWTVDLLKGRGSAIFAKSRKFPVFLVRGGN
jgi:hypothetical protein